MSRYEVGSDGKTVVDADGKVAISVVDGWDEDGGKDFAGIPCSLANGCDVALPEMLSHHWKVASFLVDGQEAVIHRKGFVNVASAVGPSLGFVGAYVWQALARVVDHDLARSMSKGVSDRLGWLHDRDGRWRNVIGGVAFVVGPEEDARPAGTWTMLAAGQCVMSGCRNAEAAMRFAEASMAAPAESPADTPGMR